jgi:hypothetical protein
MFIHEIFEEKQKGVDGKACWDGYKRMGTKQKGGRTVDNCVKVNENEYESSSRDSVISAITRRVIMQNKDLLVQHGPDLVMQAIESVADFVGEVDEIGSSDVSAWVNSVKRELESN